MTTSSSADFSRGDVVIVLFQFTDLSGLKPRPVVVVSSDAYNRRTPDLVVASITSNLQAGPHPGDHFIADWQGAGLLRPSLAQAKVTTIAQAIVRRRLGRLAPPDLAEFDAGLRLALGL
jgi:mRNA interferase MazF